MKSRFFAHRIASLTVAVVWVAMLSVASAAESGENSTGAGANGQNGIAEMVDARIVGDDRRTRFVADLSEAVAIDLFTLADPYRVVLDLPEIIFALPEGIGEIGRGMVSAFRYGQISPGKSRIVLDVTEPVSVDRSYVLPPVGEQPARLVIDVVSATHSEFLTESSRYRDAGRADATARPTPNLVPQTIDKNDQIVIVIDPGHGGIDSGAVGSTNVLEKKITLEFAELLGQKLETTGLYTVEYTRIDDSFISLGKRVEFARSINADLFVSIHANSFSSRSVRGTVIYTVSDEASGKMAAEIAASENQSDILAGLDIDKSGSDGVVDILIDLTRRETRNFGIFFANRLISELRTTTRMFKIPHQQAGFKVLEAPDVPSAMIELGYLSNSKDEKLLLSPQWREKTADSIVRAIDGYFGAKVVQNVDR